MESSSGDTQTIDLGTAGNLLTWPSDSHGPEGPAFTALPGVKGFSAEVAEGLRDKGWCLIQMPDSERLVPDTVQEVEEADEWSRCENQQWEYERAYLGHGPPCRFVRLGAAMNVEDALTPTRENPAARKVQSEISYPLSMFDGYMDSLRLLLLPVIEPFLGIVPDIQSHRLPIARRTFLGEAPQLTTVPVGEDRPNDFSVHEHIDFIQRRRLCMLYVISTDGGYVQLLGQKAHVQGARIRVPLARDHLLVFRHDMFSFAYWPGGPNDIALQSWVLQEAERHVITHSEGGLAAMERAIGSQKVSVQTRSQVMALKSQFPGRGRNLEATLNSWATGVQGTIKIPIVRFDMDAYYEEGADASSGKAGTCHMGLCGEDEWAAFDNSFFGITESMAAIIPPLQRVAMTVAMEAFDAVGYTRESLRGQAIALAFGNSGYDWNSFYGAGTEEWLTVRQVDTKAGVIRVAYTLGLTGPPMEVDTACSSSLTTVNTLDALIRNRRNSGLRTALSLGTQNDTAPWGTIGMYTAGMIGRGGRCKWADISADGFNQGEGVGGILFMVTDDALTARDRLAVIDGTFINQDGRSASMTAPNGPSQQLCMRGSARDGGVGFEDITFQENHATGTALGDPVEVGSVSGVFRVSRRETGRPLGCGGKKSNTSHCNGCSGSVTICCGIIQALTTAQVPQLHLRTVNQNMDLEGFPQFFPVELTDASIDHLHHGCNSYGFGGTNCGAIVWSGKVHAEKNAVKRQLTIKQFQCFCEPCPRCLNPMCHVCMSALRSSTAREQHKCSGIRAEFPGYEYCSDCYAGIYSQPQTEAISIGSSYHGKIYIVGTWDAWSGFEEMQFDGLNSYVAQVGIGDTLVEHFFLVIDQDLGHCLFPLRSGTNHLVGVDGPKQNEQGKYWRIDARRARAFEDTEALTYQIRFTWGEDDNMSISWTPSPLQAQCLGSTHAYTIIRSQNAWQMENMIEDHGDVCESRWYCTFLLQGKDRFLILRDGDRSQTIYPLTEEKAARIMGPDVVEPSDKAFIVHGKPGDSCTIKLHIKHGHMIVEAFTARQELKCVWSNTPQTQYNVHYVMASWAEWTLLEMEVDDATPDQFRSRFVIGQHGWEEFHIVLNKNQEMTMYPLLASAAPGSCLLCGPDRNEYGLNWRVVGYYGQAVEVLLDLAAEDYYGMLNCRPL